LSTFLTVGTKSVLRTDVHDAPPDDPQANRRPKSDPDSEGQAFPFQHGCKRGTRKPVIPAVVGGLASRPRRRHGSQQHDARATKELVVNPWRCVLTAPESTGQVGRLISLRPELRQHQQ
jgi:hypothetical protein